MRDGFEVYRAVDQDAEDNRTTVKNNGKLKMPVLALGGTARFFLPIAKPMLAEVAKGVTARPIPQCGHWIAEENPVALIGEVNRFLPK